MAWYYAEDGRRHGPLSEHKFNSLVEQGAIRTDTLVWREGMKDWQAYGIVSREPVVPASATNTIFLSGTNENIAASDEAANCVECRQPFPTPEMLRYGDMHVCAKCKPIFFQRVQEGGALPRTLEYAGFRVRFFAKLLDIILLQVLGAAMFFAAGIVFVGVTDENALTTLDGILRLMDALLATIYSVIFIGTFAATPGKMVFGLKVIRPDGGRVTHRRAFGRVLAEVLSVITLGIGYIIVAFDEQKRALHDHVASTRVIKRN